MNRILAVVAAVTFLTVQAVAQNNGADAGALIAAATKAMGTASLRSLQYTGTGSINMTGQAYTTGGAWPRYTVTKYTNSPCCSMKLWNIFAFTGTALPTVGYIVTT